MFFRMYYSYTLRCGLAMNPDLPKQTSYSTSMKEDAAAIMGRCSAYSTRHDASVFSAPFPTKRVVKELHTRIARAKILGTLSPTYEAPGWLANDSTTA